MGNVAGARDWPLVASSSAAAFFRNYTDAVSEARATLWLLAGLGGALVASVGWWRGSVVLPASLSGWLLMLLCGAVWIALLRYWAAGPSANLAHATLVHKLAIVTGCNTGIGRETVRGLWRQGATVVLACRDTRKADSAVQHILATEIVGRTTEILPPTTHDRLVVMPLDVSSLASVRAFVRAFHARFGADVALDILVNNAGIVSSATGFQTSPDGFEATVAVNYLGHFLLTQLLMHNLLLVAYHDRNPTNPAAGRSAGTLCGRVINVSSMGGNSCPLTTTVDDILGVTNVRNPAHFAAFEVYAQTKLAQIMHARALQARYGERGLYAYSLHPGGVHTDIWHENVGHRWLVNAVVHFLANLTWKNWWQGAQTTLYCATDYRAVPGAFHVDCRTWAVTRLAVDDAKGQELWDKSVAMTQAPVV